ncbi:helix-turn-helix domain-containing protein [Leuconostoc gelidum]|uniref:helix-turn-helix domain-containing protein n=1 Tax=Leuconostoc gelidum TaxID=1244 RepID=UPI001CC7461A|nr:helix-turn-helix transcriptional regulator [Leuconostoc gelidum]MBZ6000918.1 helix-turn-helix transcriptional regulator [Leuconostoc gelidum subsp. gelidum]
MLKNLEKLRKERSVTLVDMADLLHVRYQTISDKISGTSDFKFNEAVLIQKQFFPEFDLIYLFSNENSSEKQPA